MECDSDWEAGFAERLERIDRVRGYLKNHGLGFEIPYAFMGTDHQYRPDFIVHWDDGQPDPLQLVVEIKGRREAQDDAKFDALRALWIPAVNNDGRFGRWGEAMITRPFDMAHALERMVEALSAAGPVRAATPA